MRTLEGDDWNRPFGITVPRTLSDWAAMTAVSGGLTKPATADLLRTLLASPLASFLTPDERDLCEMRALAHLSDSAKPRYLDKKASLGLDEGSILPWSPDILRQRIAEANVSPEYQAKVIADFKLEGRAVHRWEKVKEIDGGPTRFYRRKGILAGVAREILSGVPGRLLWHLSVSRKALLPTAEEVRTTARDLLPASIWLVQVTPPGDRDAFDTGYTVHLWESPEAEALGNDRIERPT